MIAPGLCCWVNSALDLVYCSLIRYLPFIMLFLPFII